MTDLRQAIADLCKDAIAIAENWHDPEWQKRNFPTMHPRSNMNGRFGEFEQLFTQELERQTRAALIGELEAQVSPLWNALDSKKPLEQRIKDRIKELEYKS